MLNYIILLRDISTYYGYGLVELLQLLHHLNLVVIHPDYLVAFSQLHSRPFS